jgi:hypothetical protein
MESQAQFDLNDAILRWRRNLERLPALGAGDTEELESHLRDSIETLRVRGLTLEEAFLIASQRLGPPRQLEREYGKMNPQGVWMERGLWMIAGVLYYALVRSCAAIASVSILHFFMSWSMNGRWCALISVLAKWIVEVASVVVFLRLVTRHSEQGARFVNLCLRRPLLPMLGIVALNYGRLPFYHWLVVPSAPATAYSPEFARIMNSWQGWCGLGEMVVFISVFVFLLRFQRRMLDGLSLKPEKCRVETLEPPLRDMVRVLQCEGLSEAEAAFIVTRRQGQSPEPIDTVKNSETRQVWMERCLWMLCGILIDSYLVCNLWFAVQDPGLRLLHWLPINGHLLGLSLVCTDLTVVVLFVALLWRFVTRHKTLALCIAQFGVQRPVLGTVGLMLLLNSLFLLPGLLVNAVPQVPDVYGSTHIALQWMIQGKALLHNAIPVLLLFWLGRHRMKLQPAI